MASTAICKPCIHSHQFSQQTQGFGQPQFLAPNVNYFPYPNVNQQTLMNAQTQFGMISQMKGIPSLESFRVWNTIVPQFQQFQQFPVQQNKRVELLRLVEGFNQRLIDKQPGGKDNIKHAIPKQVVELSAQALPKGVDPNTLTCKSSVCGYDRSRRDKVILGEMEEQKFVENNKRYLAVFDSLIVKFSSHLNGQKLSLRFTLLDSNKTAISFVDSFEFETITKRGLEKQEEREKRKRVETIEDSLVSHVNPTIGPCSGGQLVKVYGQNFVCPPMSQAIIKFGDKFVREIHSIKRNVIVCEAPPGDIGVVPVNVSFDRKTFIPSDARYQYININSSSQDGLQVMLQSMFQTTPLFTSQDVKQEIKQEVKQELVEYFKK